MNYLKIIWFGIHETLSKKKYVLLFVSISVVMMSLFVLVPTWTVSGNTVLSQLTIFTSTDLFILALLTIISALYMTMQIFVMRTGKKIQGVGATVGGAFGALFAGITGTAFCASCLAPLFAIFGIGFGGLIFVLEYRLYFVAGILVLMFIALFLTARKIMRVCVTCE